MQVLKEWAISLCVCGILCSVIMLLSPSKNLEKVLRLVCVLAFIICFCIPLSKLNISSFSFDITSSQTAYTSPNDGFCKGMEFLIYSELNKIGIKPISVTVSLDADNKPQVVLSLQNPAYFAVAKSKIEALYGIDASLSK